MKKILVSLLLCLSAVHASAEVWVMPNTGGGKITLTKEACPADNYRYTALKKAYTWTNALYIEGCWAVIDGAVHITWMHSDGTRERRVYDIKSFTQVQ